MIPETEADSSYFESFCFAVGILTPLLVYFLWKGRQYGRGGAEDELTSEHVLVSGGSSGIGLEIAKESARRGANVTIISRGGSSLADALDIIKAVSRTPSQKIAGIPLDLTEGSKAVTAAIKALEDEGKPVDILFNCAGAAICGRVEDLTDEQCRELMELDYSGTLWLTRAVLPGMKRRKKGRIVFTSSGAALLGIYGYSVYGATKWAVRGLGEALFQELIDTGVTLTIAFPPDTDTPGLQQENKTKPPETKIISESGGLYKPEKVANQMIKDALNGKPYSTVGFESALLLLLCCLTPRGMTALFKQFFLMGPVRLLFACFQYYFYRVIIGMKKKRENNKKAE